jgi:hypothetical protein
MLTLIRTKNVSDKIPSQWFKIVFIVFILSTGISPKNGDEADDLRWEKAEKLVEELAFSQEFRDSLSNFYTIGPMKGLRTLTGNKLPFLKREKVVYNGGWGFIKAGFGIMEAHIDNANNEVLIEGKAISNNFVSAFFTIRDYARAYIDLNGLYPCFFEQHIRENRYQKDDWVLYDHVNGKLITNRKKKVTEYPISPFSHSYMTLLYYLRALNLAPGDTFSINCFVHGKDYPVFFKVLGREKIKVDAGVFNCIKIEPKLVGEGRGFTKKDKMHLWLTDDQYHMLVKGKSKVAMGWISAELLYYDRE